MPTSYHRWNEAILHYITNGLQGSPVFLAMDEEAIIDAGELLDPPIPVSERVKDFTWAVGLHCVEQGKVTLLKITPDLDDFKSKPPYVAFLAATVLAAYHMNEDETQKLSSRNYFKRLEDILKLDTTIDRSRPPGMDTGEEAQLWEHWNKWLEYRGYLASAQAGKGPQKYINYPISQTLLREADKRSLWDRFIQRNWPKNRDQNTVNASIIRNKKWLTKHLEELLSGSNASRRERVLDAIYELYEQWASSDVESGYDSVSRTRERNLTAGIYRTMNYFTNRPSYSLLPRQPRHISPSQIKVLYRDKSYQLTTERSGWCAPLWSLGPEELDVGIEAKLIGQERLRKLVLLPSDFRILKPDPDDLDSGIYASWSDLDLGTRFILLCKDTTCSEQLSVLKKEGLIEWGEGPVPIWEDTDWVEYREMRVISPEWPDELLKHKELFRGLQPSSSLGISFRGGMRLLGGWIEGYPPELIVQTYYSDIKLEIIHQPTDTAVFEDTFDTAEPISWKYPLKSSNYVFRVVARSESKERAVHVFSWADLPMPSLLDGEPISIGHGRVLGALVEKSDSPILTKTYSQPQNSSLVDNISSHAVVLEEQQIADIAPGDSVVHIVYGRGHYLGLVTCVLDDISRKYLLIDLGCSKQVYVPISQVDRLSRNVDEPSLNPNRRRIKYQPPPESEFEDPFDLSLESDEVEEEKPEVYNQLLYWLSITGTGTWHTFKQTCQSLGIERNARHIFRRFRLLGHVEYTTDDGSKWAVCPPCLVQIDDEEDDPSYFLAGQRTPKFIERLGNAYQVAELVSDSQSDVLAPDRIRLYFDFPRDVRSLAQNPEIGLRFAGKASHRLAAILPDLSGYQASLTSVPSPVLGLREVKKWQSNEFIQVSFQSEAGMYQLTPNQDTKNARIETLFYAPETDQWLKGDWYGMRYLSMRRTNYDCLVYMDALRRRFAIQPDSRWPDWYERALVLASGLLPKYYQKLLCFDHISPELARTLSDKLQATIKDWGQ